MTVSIRASLLLSALAMAALAAAFVDPSQPAEDDKTAAKPTSRDGEGEPSRGSEQAPENALLRYQRPIAMPQDHPADR